MKVRLFETFSAALLSLWLGATYVRVVPMETYSKSTPPVTETQMVELAPDFDAPELVASNP